MIKNYKLIQIPLKKYIYDTTEKEAKEFFEWFLKIIPERLEILRSALKITGYEPTELDFSPESLDYIAQWFKNHITTRPLTKGERDAFKEKYSGTIKKGKYEIPLSRIVETPKRLFTEETLSLCWDIGIYFAETIRNNVKGLKWDFVKKPRNDAYYHLPVLIGFGPKKDNYFSPKDIMGTIASRILRRVDASNELRETYEHWKYSAEHPKGPFWWEDFAKGVGKKK